MLLVLENNNKQFTDKGFNEITLLQEIILLEQDNELSIVVVMKAPFGEYYGEVFDEDGNVVLAYNGNYKNIVA